MPGRNGHNVVPYVGTAVAIRSELFGLSPVDPLAFLFAAGVLVVVVLLASLVPARMVFLGEGHLRRAIQSYYDAVVQEHFRDSRQMLFLLTRPRYLFI